MDHAVHGQGTGDHRAHVDHTGHEKMFRDRFWVCLALSIPVLLYSEMIQMWLGFTAPASPGSEWVVPVFSVVVFLYGGVPFLQMAVPELQSRQPGMMTLISLAISVAFVCSLAAVIFYLGGDFFWELVTLIDVMLLGHWLEMPEMSLPRPWRAPTSASPLAFDLGDRLQCGRSTTVCRRVGVLGNPALPGGRRPVHVAQHGNCGV